MMSREVFVVFSFVAWGFVVCLFFFSFSGFFDFILFTSSSIVNKCIYLTRIVDNILIS